MWLLAVRTSVRAERLFISTTSLMRFTARSRDSPSVNDMVSARFIRLRAPESRDLSQSDSWAPSMGRDSAA